MATITGIQHEICAACGTDLATGHEATSGVCLDCEHEAEISRGYADGRKDRLSKLPPAVGILSMTDYAHGYFRGYSPFENAAIEATDADRAWWAVESNAGRSDYWTADLDADFIDRMTMSADEYREHADAMAAFRPKLAGESFE